MSDYVYENVTKQITDALSKGVVPWRRPWQAYGAGYNLPQNLVTGRTYSGINVFLLALSGGETPFWLTYKQAKALGGSVRRGQRGIRIIFWNVSCKKENDNGEEVERKYGFLKQYTVFNAGQCDGLKSKRLEDWKNRDDDAKKEFNPIDACEKIAGGYHGPSVNHDGFHRAFYRVVSDSIHLPVKESFDSEAEYYSTLFHEQAHSTGNKGRLNRKGVTEGGRFGSDVYSEEELVAEFAAAFLCGVAGIAPSTVDNSAAYIKGWLKALKNDKKLIVVAASAGCKAADYVRGIGVSKVKKVGRPKKNKIAKAG